MLLLGLLSLMASCFLGGYLWASSQIDDLFGDSDIPKWLMPLLATDILVFLCSLWLIVSSVT